MAIFVEDFMEGIMGDSELACYHQKFQDPEEMEMLKEKLVCYFKYKLDGARFYIGKPMADVHRTLGISDEVFDKACLIFTASLKKLKTKMDVMRPFVQRISGIRNEICFPPINDDEEVTYDTKTETESLFKALGSELGLRNIVDSMIEQARNDKFQLFDSCGTDENQLQDSQFVTKYSMYLASLLDTQY